MTNRTCAFICRPIASAVAGLLMILPAQLSWAQGSVYADAAVSWGVSTTGSGSVRCGDTGTLLIYKSSSNATCFGGPSFPGFNGSIGKFQGIFLNQATATAVKGSLGSLAAVSWFVKKDDSFPNVTFNPTTAGGTSTTKWEDQARFAVMGPVNNPLKFMDITFRVTGKTDGVIGTGINGFDVANTATTVAFTGSTAGSSFFSSQVLRDGNRKQTMPAIPQFQTLRVGVNGLVSNPFSYLLSTQALVDFTVQFFSEATIEGWLETDFSHTVTPVSYSLWDDQGMDVTGRYGVTFDQGLQIATQQSVVPEPGTVGMMLFGFAGVVVTLRVRRRRVL